MDQTGSSPQLKNGTNIVKNHFACLLGPREVAKMNLMHDACVAIACRRTDGESKNINNNKISFCSVAEICMQVSVS